MVLVILFGAAKRKKPSKSESELKVTSPDKISGNDSGELVRIIQGVNNAQLQNFLTAKVPFKYKENKGKI